MRDPGQLHVVLPAYNEARAIGGVIRELRATGFVHILVVDDGSSDMTSEVAKSLKVRVVRHPVNLGAGAAVQTAIRLARRLGWPAIALMDADGQHRPGDILKMLQFMQEHDLDLVVGSRFRGNYREMPRLRRFYNFLANRLTNVFTHRNYSDSQSGLRLLSRRAIEGIDLAIDGFGFCSEMLLKAENAGLKIDEVGTTVRYTDYSLSKGQDFQVGLNTAFHFVWNSLFK